MSRLLAVALLLAATLAPSGWRSLPVEARPACEPEGRGTPPGHWVGCRGDPGPPRELSGLELVHLGRPVDLNRATTDDLAAIPGIGPGLAAEVVRERQERGPFDSPDSLRRVRGIGPARLERARPWVRVSPP